VPVQRVAPTTITPVMQAFGEIQSRRNLEIRSKIAGTVLSVSENFITGGKVHAGQPLVELDPVDLQTALERTKTDQTDAKNERDDAISAFAIARDELIAAENQQALQERALQRQLDLLERNVGTEAGVEAAQLSAAQAMMSVLSARRNLAQSQTRENTSQTALTRAGISLAEAKRNLSHTTIRAEFDGTLSDVSIVAGRILSANEQIAELIDDSSLEVSFRISTAQHARLLDGGGILQRLPVTVSLDAFDVDNQSTGQIDRVGADVSQGQTGRQIFANLSAHSGLKSGDFVTVRIEEPSIDGVALLPAAALGSDGTLLVLGEDNRLQTVPVTIRHRQGDDVIIDTKNLTGKDVVTERTALIGPGVKVKPQRVNNQTKTEASLQIDQKMGG